MEQIGESQEADDPNAGPADNDAPFRVLSTNTILTIIGWELIAIWAIWWAINLIHGRMVLEEMTWIPVWNYLGLDFLHNYFGAIAWLCGRDPYVTFFGDTRGLYSYPPIVLPLFGWCGWFTYPHALYILSGFIAFLAVVATGASLQFRRLAGLSGIPAPLAIGAVLMSTPVLFAMERGNCDAYVLWMLLLAAWLFTRRKHWVFDLLAATCLALGAWVKIYPMILAPGLIGVRRSRAAWMMIVMVIVIGAIMPQSMTEWVRGAAVSQAPRVGSITAVVDWLRGAPPATQPAPPNATLMQRPMSEEEKAFFVLVRGSSHSLNTYWEGVWTRLGVDSMARVPGLLPTMLLFLPLGAWCAYRVHRANLGSRIIYPYLLWLTALGTYMMPMSFDYNLIYLPLLLLAIWDRKMPWLIHLLLLPTILWWQPLKILPPSVSVDVLVISKLLTIVGATLGLIWFVERRGSALPVAEKLQ